MGRYKEEGVYFEDIVPGLDNAFGFPEHDDFAIRQEDFFKGSEELKVNKRDESPLVVISPDHGWMYWVDGISDPAHASLFANDHGLKTVWVCPLHALPKIDGKPYFGRA